MRADNQSKAEGMLREKAPISSVSQTADKTPPLVSAIVSTYNAERFIRGCLEDLEGQTIVDRLEIIVVDSGSRQNEWAIVKEFQARYDNIVYLRTAKRESVYAAWNRGIKAARGKYVTNANTDDRHKRDAFERMVAVLEARPDIALVYANLYITMTENETFEQHTRVSACRYSEFDALKLIHRNFIGPQPMWRKSMHEKYGYFDESFESVGDREFWLRMAETETFFHLDEFLGLYLNRPTSLGHRDRELTRLEALRVQQRYLHRLSGPNAASSGLSVSTSTDLSDRETTPVSPIIGFNDLKVGQRVKVIGKPGERGAFVALKITTTAQSDEAVIDGFIQDIGHQKNTLRLLNRDFALPEGVEIKDLQGLKVGDRVKLKGNYSERTGFLPAKIKMKESMDLSIEIVQGKLGKIDRKQKTLDVAGFTVMVNENTWLY